MNAAQILIEAADLISQPGVWAKGNFVMGRHCAATAIARVEADGGDGDPLLELAHTVDPKLDAASGAAAAVIDWNDKQTSAQYVAYMMRAAARSVK